MGVLNATPDSFYDGDRYAGDAGIRQVERLAREGAFVIDIGGESTRPGAEPVDASEQIRRIELAVQSALLHSDVWVSIDTANPAVADVALGWGAHIINDASCLANPELARVVARHRAALLLMHARGSMAQMTGFSAYPEFGYDDVVTDIAREWTAARALAVSAGVANDDILFDPGIGFAKSARHSLELIRRLDEFAQLDAPIVVGPSRKSFLNAVEACPPEARLGASVTACLECARRGAKLVRVHDVQVTRQALLAQRVMGRSQEGACSTVC
jgi:dihydropteroate synthase